MNVGKPLNMQMGMYQFVPDRFANLGPCAAFPMDVLALQLNVTTAPPAIIRVMARAGYRLRPLQPASNFKRNPIQRNIQ
jgi:hypothetical protein